MLVIGTAGHIDHGKSAIVKRLTGTDPDRLPEEKARGMTIDLGFAFYETPDKQTIALVDVPGHERFVKNMISGASGIDAVMLVIAADDGWMPQSEEHFQITRLLGISSGIIVINKSDLAEDQWLEIVKSDITEKVKDSFLSDAPVIVVSAQSGDGFDNLKQALNRLAQSIIHKRDIGKARLYIDRSFISKGFGAVVTGTLRDGSFSIGQTLSIWPSLKKAKVRSLQSNSKDVERASPGQRTAVSLTGVDKEELRRGRVLMAEEDLLYLKENQVLALKVELLKDSPLSLTNRRRLVFITGTTECEGEIRVFNSNTIIPGQSGTIFFRPDEPIYARLGDHFIVRLPTPMVSLGGGIVIDHLKQFPRRKESERFGYLEMRNDWQLDKLIVSELRKETMIKRANLLKQSSFSVDNIESELEDLLSSGKCSQINDYVYETKTFEKIADKTVTKIENFLKEQSHFSGLTLEQIEQLVKTGKEKTKVILNYLVANKKLSIVNEKYDLVNRDTGPQGKIREAFDDIMRMITENPFSPPRLADIASTGSFHRQAIKYILDNKTAYKCGTEFLFSNEAWHKILEHVRDCLTSKGELTVSDFRDKLSLSRKYSIPILEEIDRIKITQRKGDIRVKGENFEK